jgi:hypothetical protein
MPNQIGRSIPLRKTASKSHSASTKLSFTSPLIVRVHRGRRAFFPRRSGNLPPRMAEGEFFMVEAKKAKDHGVEAA